MADIYSLLKLNADFLSGFGAQARLVENAGIERTLKHNIRRLEQISRLHDAEVGCAMTTATVDIVVEKVNRMALDGIHEAITPHELWIVAYHLSQFHAEPRAYFLALALLESQWRNLFFHGIASYLLSSWNYIRNDYRSRCVALFTSRLQSYSGSIARYLKLKECIDFFQVSGPMRLGTLLAHKNVPLRDAPQFLGFKQSAFAHSYFSDVIIKYIKDTKQDDLGFLEEEVFAYHNEDRTKKLVFTHLVIAAEEEDDAIHCRAISAAARHVLGDITLPATWAPFLGATEEETARLRRAFELVNLWANRMAIKAFFEVCVQDKARKDFWIKYANEVTGFKIAGSSLIKRLLQQDPRIDSQTLDRCFVDTSSNYSKTAALILVIRRRVIVEFSDVGSVYAYKMSNPAVASVIKGRKSINKVEDLKTPWMPLLVESSGYYYQLSKEGRLPHYAKWEERLHIWLKDIVFAPNNTDSRTKERDDIFRSEPISSPSTPVEDTALLTTPEDRYESGVAESEASITDESDDIAEIETDTETPETTFYDSTANSSESIWTELDSEILISSKWIFDSICQVVGTSNGFYIQVWTGQTFRFAKILDYDFSNECRGQIWIKKANADNWRPIIHHTWGTEHEIGILKLSDEGILYRASAEESDYRIIPIE